MECIITTLRKGNFTSGVIFESSTRTLIPDSLDMILESGNMNGDQPRLIFVNSNLTLVIRPLNQGGDMGNNNNTHHKGEWFKVTPV